ncbi:putative DHHC palmitoyltransferase [Trypanosoma vivax]|nr:hypothetical protein TRVL_09368 [Trypanosoma vivax]KAH8609542.1 putative DHHC palmitoyltransferase [Trypanosoma vivax]
MAEMEEVPTAAYDGRYNEMAAALGELRRARLCGTALLWSADGYAHLFPTALTIALSAGIVCPLWGELGACELCVFACFLIVAYASSLLLVSTDPGVYPRLRLDEEDPLRDYMELVYCRVCNLRRPPRAAHCYVCNVCVLDHDHHCGVLGGCVGRRSLRWFILYLMSAAAAALMAVVWLFRSLCELSNAARAAHGGGAEAEMHRTPRGQMEGVKPMMVVLLFVVALVVLMFVGGFCVFQVWLALTSTTRRESQRREGWYHPVTSPRVLWRNVLYVVFPPPSLLEAPKSGTSSLLV